MAPTAAVLSAESPSLQEDRLVGATLRCIARWGITKTTFDDVAREAGCSRATVYRTFPGGKDALLAAVLDAERERILTTVGDALDRARTLPDVLVALFSESARLFAAHDALRFVIRYEPEIVLPRLAFAEMDRFLAAATSFLAPDLARFFSRADAERVAEWVTRIGLSYLLSPTPEVDFTDDASVRRLVAKFVVPATTALTTRPVEEYA